MAERNERPGAQQVTIPDCASVRIVHNDQIRCPHGKFWRTVDVQWITDKRLKERFCKVEACAAAEYTPQAGNSITLLMPKNFRERVKVNTFFNQGARGNDGELVPTLSEGDAVELLREILSVHVIAWTWTGQEDDGSIRDLPLPSADWDTVIDYVDVPELRWIANALLVGMDPDEAKRQAGNGYAG